MDRGQSEAEIMGVKDGMTFACMMSDNEPTKVSSPTYVVAKYVRKP